MSASLLMARPREIALGVLFFALWMSGARAGEDQPLWEFGAGATALSFPAYRGSDTSETLLLPLPYVTYHGKVLKSDRHGVRGQLFESDRFDLTVSAALSPPAPSKDIEARRDMPDLRATFEIGPQFDATLWRSPNRARFLKILVPVRAAYTAERSPKHIGWVLSPKLNMDITDLPGMPGWNLGLLAGPVFGDREQNRYFYSVPSSFATPQRPAYEASGGYAGMQYLASISKRFPRFWVGGFVRYDNLTGATFDPSPLMRERDNFAAGIALFWILAESSTRVPADD